MLISYTTKSLNCDIKTKSIVNVAEKVQNADIVSRERKLRFG